MVDFVLFPESRTLIGIICGCENNQTWWESWISQTEFPISDLLIVHKFPVISKEVKIVKLENIGWQLLLSIIKDYL